MLAIIMIGILLVSGYMLLALCVLVFLLQLLSLFLRKIEAEVISIEIKEISFDHKNVESNLYKLACSFKYKVNGVVYISESTNPMVGVFSTKKKNIEKLFQIE